MIDHSDLALTYFHVSGETYSEGGVKEGGTYGKSILVDAHAKVKDPYGEYLREEIREKHYPKKPNRFKSNFVFEALEDAVRFRDNFRQGHKIYRVSFASEPNE